MNKNILAGILIVAMFMIVPTPTVQAQSSVQNPGIFINEVTSWAPSNLDPATNYETQGGGIVQLAYEGLLTYANNSLTTLTDSLAYSNYTVSKNGLVYTFTTKSGITFATPPPNQNLVGQPFNAYVEQYSIERAIIMNDPQGGIPYTIGPWIANASNVQFNSLNKDGSTNFTVINQFLEGGSVKALDANHLQITLAAPFLGFIQALQFWGADAISPKAIIDNQPLSYTTNSSASNYGTMGMVPLTTFFPGKSNATILANLGLPSSYSVLDSGVVPNAPANSGSPNEYTWTYDHSAGTGPWIVSSNTENIGATLVRNPNWWDAASVPKTNSINTIIWKQVPETNSRILDLKSGATDASQIPFSSLYQLINTTSLKPLVSGISVNHYFTLDNEFIGFNMFPTIPGGQISESSSSNYAHGTMNYTRLHMYTWNFPNGTAQMASPGNPFTALKFREAFAYAYNYQTYIKSILAGFAIRMQGAIPLGLPGADQNLISQGYIPTYQPSVAKTLFQAVGWKGTITLTYNTGSTARQESASLLKQAIDSLNVGISINIQEIAWQQYLTYIFNGQAAMWQLGWAPDYADAQDYTVPYYANATVGGLYSAIENYNNPYVTQLVVDGGAANSTVTRTNIYKQMEQNATQDFPYIYLDQSEAVIITRDWIHGISNPATNSMVSLRSYPEFQWLTKSAVSTSSTGTGATKATTPGFEVLAMLASVSVIALFEIRNRRKRV